MLWSTESIQKLLNLYFEHRELWDPSSSGYGDKNLREKGLQQIAENLGMPNLTAEDVHRKYRSMRAAYRVEVRNINTAKVRGFFYKPTLHWFDIFQQFMKETEEATKATKLKEVIVPQHIVLHGGLKDNNQYVFTMKDEKKSGLVNKSLPPNVSLAEDPTEIDMEMEEDSAEEGYSSEETDDEFQSFSDHIAEQLRSMSVHRAVMIQNQIQGLFAHDRQVHEELHELE